MAFSSSERRSFAPARSRRSQQVSQSVLLGRRRILVLLSGVGSENPWQTLSQTTTPPPKPSRSIRDCRNRPRLARFGSIAITRTTTWSRIRCAGHLAEHVEHLAVTKSYHGGQIAKGFGAGDIGESSEGAFSSGGAQGSDYQTTNVGDTPDADSAGPTGF
jgi:hypothetical protein